MVNGLFIWNRKNRLYVLLFLILFFGCNKLKDKHQNQIKIDTEKIESGYLICRLGNGYFSDYFRRYGSKDQRYSHIGIISKENDSIYVYHSEASEFTGVGYVKKERLGFFLKKIEVFDFYEFSFSDSIKTNILNSVKDYYKKRTPFDLKFNSLNDKELYCTELIATSINNNITDSIKIKPSTVLNGKKLYLLDDIYKNKNVKKFTKHK